MSDGSYYYKDMPETGFPVDVTQRIITNAGTITGLHWHEHLQFFHFTEGEAIVQCGPERLSVIAGDLVIVNARELHSWESRSDVMRCTVIRVDFSFLSGRATDSCQEKYIAPIESGQISFSHLVREDCSVISCVEELSREYADRRDGYELAIKGILYRLLVQLFRGHIARQLTLRERNLRDLNNRRLTGVFKYIEENIGEKIFLEDLASLANVSSYYFCKLFRSATGTTFIEYINRRRMEKAEQLLRDTEKSVTDIAFDCGIPDSNYFSRMFRKYRGVSPMETRRITVTPRESVVSRGADVHSITISIVHS